MIVVTIFTDDREVYFKLDSAGLKVHPVDRGYRIRINSARDMQKAYTVLLSLGLFPE